MKKLYLIILLSLSVLFVEAQVNAGPDSTICLGQTIELQGSGPANWDYLWTSTPIDPSISDPTILNPEITPLTTAIYAYKLEGSTLDPFEYIVNGDFDDGFTGFTSSYLYCDQANCLLNSPSSGKFAIGDDPSYFHTSFSSCEDHTSTGFRYMMICNGDNGNNYTLYETTVNNIDTYTDYQLSTWITSLTWSFPQFGAHFTFEINGAPVGSFSATSSICTWSQFKTSWNSEAATSATIRIVNTSQYWNLGNDFALDDISFKAIIKDIDYCVVTVNDEAITDFDIPASSCYGDTVTITYTGNASPVATYNWDFGTDAVIISGTNQGPYEVTWTSVGTKTTSLEIDNGCPSTATYHDIEITESPEIDITADDNPIPFGTQTILRGIITSGDSPQFSWVPASMLEDPLSQNPQTIPLDQPTTFYFTVTDGVSLCSSTDSITIEVDGGPLTLVSLIATPDTICPGLSTNLLLDISGGSGNYTATWSSDPAGYSYSGPEMNVTVSPNLTTTYFVDVDDGYNTVSSSVKVVLHQNTEITSQPQSLNLISGTSASFSTSANYATNYLWQVSTDGGNSWTDLTNSSPYSGVQTNELSIIPVDLSMDGNMFRCKVSGECGDINSQSATLNVSDTPAFIADLGVLEGCEGEQISLVCTVQNFIQITDFTIIVNYVNTVVEYSETTGVASEIYDNLTTQNNTNTLTFSWTSAAGANVANGPLFTIVFDAISEGNSPIAWDTDLSSVTNLPGIHPTLELTNGEIIVNPLPMPVLNIDTDHDTINITDEINVSLTANGGSGDELIWSANSCDGDTIGKGSVLDIMRPDVTTNYYAYWLNQCGKSACAEAEIVIVYNYNVGYPNAFTPNNDGLNDEFKIVSDSPLDNFKMQIFNRNGALIFESDDQNNGWNGTYKSTVLPLGTYIWKVSYEVFTTAGIRETINQQGTVTMIR